MTTSSSKKRHGKEELLPAVPVDCFDFFVVV